MSVIDVIDPDWYKKVIELVEEEIDNSNFFCTAQAYIVARKRLPLEVLNRVDKLEDILIANEDSSTGIAAARIGDMVVTKKYHPAVIDSKVWMSPYHITLIKELFTEGFVIEILDEQNNPIVTLGETE